MNRHEEVTDVEDKEGLIASDQALEVTERKDGSTTIQERRGGYHSVSSVEDGRGDDDYLPTEDPISTSSATGDGRWKRMWLQPMLPDDRCAIAGVKLLDGSAAVKLLKFEVLTFLGIVSMFSLVRWVVRA